MRNIPAKTVRKTNTERRHNLIKRRVNHLYNEERKRFDDVVAQVSEEFAYSVRTVRNILAA